MQTANQQGKPRISYAQFQAQQQQEKTKGTLAELIGRFTNEMNATTAQRNARPLGTDSVYRYAMLERLPIGQVAAVELHRNDIIAHCRTRIAAGVKPATVMHDVVCLTNVLKYAPGAWEDCEDVSDAPIAAAKPFLLKHNMVGKSIPRDRRPANDAQATKGAVA